jgi:tetratricopeptide (TPR) repeat protein
MLGATLPALAQDSDSGVIRLRPTGESTEESPEISGQKEEDVLAEPRRGFNYESFVARLESLWFQRKTLLADGRDGDAAQQSQLIRAFCAEEGVRRLDHLSGALVAEADRHLEEGRYDQALESLELAEAFDPGRPQINFARAAVIWKSGRHRLSAIGQMLTGAKNGLLRSLQDLSLFNYLALAVVISLVASVLVFSVLMVVRYHVAFRHEIEERVVQFADDRLARSAAWAMLFLPMLLWVGTGWAALYWIVITFRFMRHTERAAAVALLIATMTVVPAYRIAVSVYGLTADPVVRTTLASADGEYNPDRIIKLRQLVHAYPEDPVYRFLLAGLYKNGRYFEEAFAEYKQALNREPAMEEAYINIGNIFHTTGQYTEALAYYRKALEVNPRSILAYFNMHLSQSESFRFKEAEESLAHARSISTQRLAEMLSAASAKDEGSAVLDASLQMGSVWHAALSGGDSGQVLGNTSTNSFDWLRNQFFNPVTIVAGMALFGCGLMLFFTRGESPARRCIRCGRPFCHYCKSGREGQEYCTQCHHLYVLGDGLAPETKTRKMYEVERHERVTRNGRRLLSTFLPGAAQLLGGRTGWGVLLLLAWFAALVAWQPIVLRPLDQLAGLDLRLDILGPEHIPAIYSPNPFSLVALPAMLGVWFLANAWLRKGRET